jgi:hypothetical protein
MTQETKDNRKFFIIEKEIFLGNTRYSIHKRNQYDITTAVKIMLALDTLNEDKERISYYLQEVDLSMVDEPLKLTDEVKEDKNWKDVIDESMPL